MSVLKICSVGNSFSEDSHEYLHTILEEAGIENECFNLVIGGCSLETHWEHMKSGAPDYMVEYNGRYTDKKCSFEEGLNMDSFDIITLQECSRFAGKCEKFEPYLGELIGYIKKVQPKARIYFHETWAYEYDFKGEWFGYYDYSQEKMVEGICNSKKYVSEKYGLPLIKSGDLIEKLRKNKYFDYKNGGMSLHRDGFHINMPYGRYALSLNWAKTLAGADISKIKFVPENADKIIAESVRKDVIDFNNPDGECRKKKSIAIVQTSGVSSGELKNLCGEIIPDVTVYQIIDDSLIKEVNANGGPTLGVKNRMYQYYKQAESLGADLILNQCSSVGEVADLIKPFVGIPVVKIDEAMARKAVSLGKKIGVVATVATTTGPSCRLIEKMAEEAGKEIEIDLHLVKDAMMILIEKGDVETHNKMVLDEVKIAAEKNDVVVLAQGSMTVLLPLLKDIDKPVLSSPRLGIEYVKEVLEQ